MATFVALREFEVSVQLLLAAGVAAAAVVLGDSERRRCEGAEDKVGG